MFRTYAPIEVTSYHLKNTPPRFEVILRLNTGSIQGYGNSLDAALERLASHLQNQLQEPNLVIETEYNNPTESRPGR